MIRFSATVPFLTNTGMRVVKFGIENKAPTQKAWGEKKGTEDGKVVCRDLLFLQTQAESKCFIFPIQRDGAAPRLISDLLSEHCLPLCLEKDRVAASETGWQCF